VDIKGGGPAGAETGMLRKLRSPMVLVVEGFLAGALLFVVANPTFVHSDSGRADAQAAALVKELTR